MFSYHVLSSLPSSFFLTAFHPRWDLADNRHYHSKYIVFELTSAFLPAENVNGSVTNLGEKGVSSRDSK